MNYLRQITVGCLTVIFAASVSGEPLDTGFTYQGKLTAAYSPANGSFDFQFDLYDVESGSSPLGTSLQDDVVVTNGVFTVELNFGSNPFADQNLWLEIGVRAGNSEGEYDLLLPRQALTNTPFSIAAGKVVGITGNSCPPFTVLTGFDSENGLICQHPTALLCGNETVEAFEECDDGNDTNGDGCENDCTSTFDVCGSAPSVVHDNGYGQTWSDCDPLGTYNLEQASEACLASTGDPGLCTHYPSACASGADSVVCGPETGDCTCWSYSGDSIGKTHNSPGGNNCICPETGDVSWQ